MEAIVFIAYFFVNRGRFQRIRYTSYIERHASARHLSVELIANMWSNYQVFREKIVALQQLLT